MVAFNLDTSGISLVSAKRKWYCRVNLDKTMLVSSFIFVHLTCQYFAGMFPYTMLATMPIFSSCDWPKQLYAQLFQMIGKKSPPVQQSQPNASCIYSRDNAVSKRKVSFAFL